VGGSLAGYIPAMPLADYHVRLHFIDVKYSDQKAMQPPNGDASWFPWKVEILLVDGKPYALLVIWSKYRISDQEAPCVSLVPKSKEPQ